MANALRPRWIDVLAAAPLVSAMSLGHALGMAVPNAAALLARFCAAGVAVEVTHRARRRLFGLAALAPLRDTVAPPYRPDPGRGRPPNLPEDADVDGAPPPLPLPPLEQRRFDYSGLEAAMACAHAAIRNARQGLRRMADDAAVHAHAGTGDRPRGAGVTGSFRDDGVTDVPE